MSLEALLVAALRTVPMALCLPLPGLVARLTFGLCLATFGSTVVSDARPLHAVVTGVALGLLVLLPVWAVRWAGGMVGASIRVRSLEGVYATIAWLVFFAAGGPLLLLSASVPLDGAPLFAHGTRLVGLAASVALPTLLALAVLEVLAAVAERFEHAAQTPFHARRFAYAARPLVASLLLLAGLASLVHGIGRATSVSAEGLARRP